VLENKNPPKSYEVPQESLDIILSEFEHYYSSTLHPSNRNEEVSIDTQGYYRICSMTYDHLVNKDDNLRKYLTKPEFMLVNGQILAHRVLYTRASATAFNLDGYQDFDRVIRTIPELLGPIHHYVSTVGVYTDASGRNVIPTMPLPQMGSLIGTIPSSASTNWTIRDDAGLSAMFPFGLLEREIDNVAGAAHPLDRENLLLGAQAHFARPGALQNSCGGVPHPHRVPNVLPHVPAADLGSDLFNSVRLRAMDIDPYNAFVLRCKQIMKVFPAPRGYTGTPVQQAIFEPDDGTLLNPPSHYTCRTYQEITVTEQHLAKVFLMRVRRTRPGNKVRPTSAAETGYTENNSTTGYRGPPPLTFNDVTQWQSAVTVFLRCFIINK